MGWYVYRPIQAIAALSIKLSVARQGRVPATALARKAEVVLLKVVSLWQVPFTHDGCLAMGLGCLNTTTFVQYTFM